MRPIKVTAILANELAGQPPMLDALLVDAMARFHPSAGGHEKYCDAPAFDKLPPIQLAKTWVGKWPVFHASSPILSTVAGDRHEHVTQHFPREHAGVLRESERGTIATTNGAQKSMRLPVRMRLVERVVWFAALHGGNGNRPSEIRKWLNRVTHIGQDRSRSHGRVAEWIVEAVEDDWSWFAAHPTGIVLMRPLPAGDWLPKNLVGFTRDFDAVTPPYFHPQRRTGVVKPC